VRPGKSTVRSLSRGMRLSAKRAHAVTGMIGRPVRRQTLVKVAVGATLVTTYARRAMKAAKVIRKWKRTSGVTHIMRQSGDGHILHVKMEECKVQLIFRRILE